MSQSAVIRSYQPTDRSAVEHIALQVVADGTVFPFEQLQGVMDYWFCESGSVYVAELNQQVVGSYVIKPVHPGRCAHIANAGYMVDAANRGRGIGLALGEHSLQQARILGYLAMQFNIVVATNQIAVQLWHRLGFSTIGTVPRAFRHPQAGLVDLLIMHRSLIDQRNE
jgi:GNAT superfamily N-acetyltransferase